MYRKRCKGFLLMIFCLLISVNEIYGSAKYTMGTFNIRLRTSSDTGDLHWDNRKTYVARTITEFNYDVIGLNEITSGIQKNDLQVLLPDYSFVIWGVQSSVVPDTGNGNMNAVAYKTDKFELLEEGHFFLSADPEKALVSWDSSQKRVTVWAKLKDKNTQEIFYFFATHLDHVGEIARREGADINMMKIRKIAGNYPIFLVGDLNSSPVRLAVYNNLCAYINDSRVVSEVPFTKKYDGTLNKWDPTNLNTSRIDFVFSRGARILTYDHITETFGRSVTPSDHLPIIVTCTLNEYRAERSVYVNSGTRQGGDGSKVAPFNNIQDAINIIESGDTIKITEGLYPVLDSEDYRGRNARLRIDKSVTIIGGYDDKFEKVVGYSHITGDFNGDDVVEGGKIRRNEENAYQIIVVISPYALELSNCHISGGNSNEGPFSSGAGISASGSKLKLENVSVYKNYSSSGGSGVQATGRLICHESVFENNITAGKGGALYLTDNKWWRHSITNSYFNENEAAQGAVAYIEGLTSGIFANNTFAQNKATSSGILSCFSKEVDATITFVNNTFALNSIKSTSGLLNKSNGGSAIYFSLTDGAIVNLVNNTIIGNSASCLNNQGLPASNFYGAAVHMMSGRINLFNNIIAGNYSTSTEGGDIYNNGTLISSKRNAYTSADNMTIQPSSSDKIQSSFQNGIIALNAMYESSIVEEKFTPNLTENGGVIPTIKVISPKYGNLSLNVLSSNDLSESGLNLDIDDDFLIKSDILNDQRGFIRLSDGTSMIGAYEYNSPSSIEDIEDIKSPKIWSGNDILYISTPYTLTDVRVYAISGILVANLSNIHEGNINIDISSLTHGVYIFVWKGGSQLFSKN